MNPHRRHLALVLLRPRRCCVFSGRLTPLACCVCAALGAWWPWCVFFGPVLFLISSHTSRNSSLAWLRSLRSRCAVFRSVSRLSRTFSKSSRTSATVACVLLRTTRYPQMGDKTTPTPFLAIFDPWGGCMPPGGGFIPPFAGVGLSPQRGGFITPFGHWVGSGWFYPPFLVILSPYWPEGGGLAHLNVNQETQSQKTGCFTPPPPPSA